MLTVARPRRSVRLPLGAFRASGWSKCSDCAHLICAGDTAFRHPNGVACGLCGQRYRADAGQGARAHN